MDMLESYAFQQADLPMKVLLESGIKGEALVTISPRLAELLQLEFPHYIKAIDEVADVDSEIAAATRLQRRRVVPAA